MNQRLRLLSALLFLALICQIEIGRANTLSYSWSGQLRLHDDASSDPWQIGKDGAEFKLTTTVNRDATDINTNQAPFADFSAVSGRLWINGEETTFARGAHIDFMDTTFDLITASGLFTKFGQTVDISSVVALDANTFSFDVMSATPPWFSPATAATIGTSSTQPYSATVTAGTVITVVPEPSAAILLAYEVLIITLGCRRTLP